MKEIKAYVRANMAHHVVEALSKEGHLDFTIVGARGVTKGLPRESYSFSVGLGEFVEEVIKIELICRDENAERLADIIRLAASTGRKGDGMIFIGPIDEAIRIENGEQGDQVLLA